MTEPKELIGKILKIAKNNGAEAVEIVLQRQKSLLKRIWYGRIHQNPAGETCTLNIGMIKNGRYVSGATTTNDPTTLEEFINERLSMIPNLAETDLPKLAEGTGYYRIFPEDHMRDPKTASLDSQEAIRILRLLKERLGPEIVFSGKIVMSEGENWFANSNGLLLRNPFTGALLTCYAFLNPQDEPETSAYASSGHMGLERIDADRVASEVLFKLRLQKNKPRLKIINDEDQEKTFDVIIEPYALAPIMGWLSFSTFNGLNYLIGSSALSGRMNQIVTGEKVSIIDDPFRISPQPFDFEGYPKKVTSFIENGVLKSVALDSMLAVKMNSRSTAHALPPTMKHNGAVPSNLVLDVNIPATPLIEMVQNSTRPTIWITKTHYIAMPHFQSAEVTGTTQHGVFLIDRVEIKPIYNLRFKQKMFEALARIEAVGPQETVYDAWDEGGFNPMFLPALKIRDFQFLGGTSLANG